MSTVPSSNRGSRTCCGLGQIGSAHIDVDVQADRGARQCSAESDADSAVMVLVTNSLCGGMLGIEEEPVPDRESF